MVKSRLKDNFQKATIFTAGFYILALSSLYLLQEKLIFLSKKLAPDFVFTSTFPFDEVFLETEKNTVINAVHYKNSSPKGVILYFHGNAGNLIKWMNITEFFVAKNYDVFVMDFRTYGKSTGTLNERGLYKDAQVCYDYLLKNYLPEDITVYGRSLGTGIATYVASKNNPKQLILETPYFSLIDVAKHRFPIFPVEKLLRYRFPSYEFVPHVNCPIVIFHGTGDRIVPYESGVKLSKFCPKESTKMITIEGGVHNNLVDFAKFREGIDDLL